MIWGSRAIREGREVGTLDGAVGRVQEHIGSSVLQTPEYREHLCPTNVLAIDEQKRLGILTNVQPIIEGL